MGALDNQSGQTLGTQQAEEALQTLAQDLKQLHRGLVGQLSQDIARLQAEKNQLAIEVNKLRTEQRALLTQQNQALSQQQITQQQVWAKQLAQALATHLHALMVQQINQTVKTNVPAVSGYDVGYVTTSNGENAQQLLTALDSSFSTTFKTLQQELNSYQSTLSQQISRMQTTEQQGEAILNALVNRLREQLQHETRLTETLRAQTPHLPPPSQPAVRDNGYTTVQPNPISVNTAFGGNMGATDQARFPLQFPGAPLPPPPEKAKQTLSGVQLGFVLVLLSTLALSIQNVVVRVVGTAGTSILGKVQTGGFLDLNVGNSLILQWFRMLIALPVMAILMTKLYPPVWRDLKKLFTSGDSRSMVNVVGSGIFLFLSQVLIYISIGQIGPGPAVTILFMYPLITVPLAWWLFNDKPTALRWGVMVAILVGVFLTSLPNLSNRNLSGGGVTIAVGSGIAFALYLIFMQLSFKRIHPVPATLVQFFTIFVLSSFALIIPVELGVRVKDTFGFLMGGVILGLLTLAGYLANNIGVKLMGAGRASIVASSGPVVTALLALLLINAQLRPASLFGINLPVQAIGIVLVTLGVAALAFERLKIQTPPPKPSR